MTELLQVTDTIAVPRSELVYRASRSGGAGGQHVNTSSTRIELLWDFQRSNALDDAQKERVRTKLAARIDSSLPRMASSRDRFSGSSGLIETLSGLANCDRR